MEWISVKQRLPEAETAVLVLSDTEIDEHQQFKHMQVAYLNGEQWLSKAGLMPGITHWMPLPPLPNEQFEAIKGVADSVADLYAPVDRSQNEFSFSIKVEGTAYEVTYQKDEEGYWVFNNYKA